MSVSPVQAPAPGRGSTASAPAIDPAVEREILAAVASLRFGSVVVTVQDGRVVQIDSTEKRRFAAN